MICFKSKQSNIKNNKDIAVARIGCPAQSRLFSGVSNMETKILIISQSVFLHLLSFEALKQNHNSSVSSLQEKLTVLSKQLLDLENVYNNAVQQSKY